MRRIIVCLLIMIAGCGPSTYTYHHKYPGCKTFLEMRYNKLDGMISHLVNKHGEYNPIHE